MLMSRRRLLLVWTLCLAIVVTLCLYLSNTANNSKAQDVPILFATPHKSYTTQNISIQLTTLPIVKKKHVKNRTTIPTKKTTTDSTKICEPDTLVGAVYINKSVPRMQEIIEQESVDYGGFIAKGGAFKPKGCIAKDKLAIIIPYRNRSEHLRIFLKHMHRILQRQMHDYRMIVVEQAGNYSFNRATLINIGFLEALKISNFGCFVFHDVDHILENDKNDYGCPESPKLLGVSVDRFHRRWPYKRYFGGVGAFSKEQFEKMNGYSNLFWGWGGEDDDAYLRIRAAGYNLIKSQANLGRYIMLKENHVRAKAGGNRHMLLKTSAKRMYTDGLNSAKYKVLKITEFPLYTHILAKLYEELDVMPNITLPTTNNSPG